MPLTKEKTGPASSGLLITTDGHDVTRRPIITAGVISVGTVEIFLHRNRMHQLFNKERHKRNTFVTVIDYNRRLRRPSDFIRLGLFWKWDSILWLRGGAMNGWGFIESYYLGAIRLYQTWLWKHQALPYITIRPGRICFDNMTSSDQSLEKIRHNTRRYQTLSDFRPEK